MPTTVRSPPFFSPSRKAESRRRARVESAPSRKQLRPASPRFRDEVHPPPFCDWCGDGYTATAPVHPCGVCGKVVRCPDRATRSATKPRRSSRLRRKNDATQLPSLYTAPAPAAGQYLSSHRREPQVPRQGGRHDPRKMYIPTVAAVTNSNTSK
jgi:hypothetical protein